MIITVTVVIVVFCFAGALLALSFTGDNRKKGKWSTAKEGIAEQRPYAHVEQGPEGLCPTRKEDHVDDRDLLRKEDRDDDL